MSQNQIEITAFTGDEQPEFFSFATDDPKNLTSVPVGFAGDAMDVKIVKSDGSHIMMKFIVSDGKMIMDSLSYCAPGGICP